MKTKGKLTVLVTIIGAVLFLAASFLIWNTIATYRLISMVSPALETFTLFKEIQSRLHRQHHFLGHFLASGEPDFRQEFTSDRRVIESRLLLLASIVHQQKLSGVEEKAEVAADIKLAQAGYGKYLEKADVCIQENLAGRSEDALRRLDNEVSPYLERELFTALGRLDQEETEEINAAYRLITMKLGALPWVAASGLKQVERASSGVAYDLAVSAAELGLYRQVNEITEFLLYGEAQDWEEFLSYRFEIRRLLAEWQQVINRQQGLGIAGEDEDEKIFVAIQASYENVLLQMGQAAVIRQTQGRIAGLEYVEHTLKPQLDNHLFPTLAAIGNGSRAEVKELHAGLLRTVVGGGAAGVSALVFLSLLLLLLAQRISNSIVSSLAKLKEGAEIIKGGDLEYQIKIAGGDEFSELASSFNAMTVALKEHNDELRSFVFSIAHDLRAPLVNLKGFSSELRSDLASVMPQLLTSLAALSPEERQRVAAVLEQAVPEALEYIDSSTQKLDSLINAVLHLSRINSLACKLELVDTEGLVQAAVQNFAHTIKEKNISVTMGPLPAVFADRMVMEQCVANLLGNAFKYLEPGRAGVVSITAEQGEKGVTFYFQDNGRGIAPDDLQRVFEIFRRAGKQDMPGEGMGLAFVKALVRRLGGNVWCESTLGEGSTFCLSIPGQGAPRR